MSLHLNYIYIYREREAGSREIWLHLCSWRLIINNPDRPPSRVSDSQLYWWVGGNSRDTVCERKVSWHSGSVLRLWGCAGNESLYLMLCGHLGLAWGVCGGSSTVDGRGLVKTSPINMLTACSFRLDSLSWPEISNANFGVRWSFVGCKLVHCILIFPVDEFVWRPQISRYLGSTRVSIRVCVWV